MLLVICIQVDKLDNKNLAYSAFQIDEPHRHNRNLVGAIRESPLLWSTVQENRCKRVKNYRRYDLKMLGGAIVLKIPPSQAVSIIDWS